MVVPSWNQVFSRVQATQVDICYGGLELEPRSRSSLSAVVVGVGVSARPCSMHVASVGLALIISPCCAT
eukprot:8631577-Pyramimonas_sp.AAC.1